MNKGLMLIILKSLRPNSTVVSSQNPADEIKAPSSCLTTQIIFMQWQVPISPKGTTVILSQNYLS